MKLKDPKVMKEKEIKDRLKEKLRQKTTLRVIPSDEAKSQAPSSRRNSKLQSEKPVSSFDVTKSLMNDDRSGHSQFSVRSQYRREDRDNRRKFKNARGNICTFFQNLTELHRKQKRSKSGDVPKNKAKNIPFQLLMGTFRRKKILETLKDNRMSYDEKNEILMPYEDYLERVFG